MKPIKTIFHVYWNSNYFYIFHLTITYDFVVISIDIKSFLTRVQFFKYLEMFYLTGDYLLESDCKLQQI